MEQKHVPIGGKEKQRSFLKELQFNHHQIWFELPILLPTSFVALGKSSPTSGPWFICESWSKCSLRYCIALKWETRDSLSKNQRSWDRVERWEMTLPLWVGLFLGHKILLKIISETCEVAYLLKMDIKYKEEKKYSLMTAWSRFHPSANRGLEIRAPFHMSPGKAGGRCFCHCSP